MLLEKELLVYFVNGKKDRVAIGHAWLDEDILRIEITGEKAVEFFKSNTIGLSMKHDHPTEDDAKKMLEAVRDGVREDHAPTCRCYKSGGLWAYDECPKHGAAGIQTDDND